MNKVLEKVESFLTGSFIMLGFVFVLVQVVRILVGV
jgi:hypothetical protein